MKTYKLLLKAQDNERERIAWARVAAGCEMESKLIIDDHYYIERRVGYGKLYYVHVKDGVLFKVCVYEEVKKEGKK